ncbi:MAG: FAD-binding oxidoreductase [Sumerlaeia bacterium]
MPTVKYHDNLISVNEEESILSALLREGHSIPHSCKSGVCQTCMMQVQSGLIPLKATEGMGLHLIEQRYFLPCVCKPTENLAVCDVGAGLQAVAVVRELAYLSDSVLRIRLLPTTDFAFRPGQFVSVIRADGVSRSYSIASLPDDGFIELHVRILENGVMSQWMATELCVGDSLKLKGAFGNCFYSPIEPSAPIVLAATGTGLAPILGVMRDALANHHSGEIILIHGACNAGGLYLNQYLQALGKAHQNLSIRQLISEAESTGSGVSTGSIKAHTLEVCRNLHAHRVYLCGNPNFVQETSFELFIEGLSPTHIFSDAFLPSAT